MGASAYYRLSDQTVISLGLEKTALLESVFILVFAAMLSGAMFLSQHPFMQVSLRTRSRLAMMVVLPAVLACLGFYIWISQSVSSIEARIPGGLISLFALVLLALVCVRQARLSFVRQSYEGIYATLAIGLCTVSVLPLLGTSLYGAELWILSLIMQAIALVLFAMSFAERHLHKASIGRRGVYAMLLAVALIACLPYHIHFSPLC